jgi:wobble nucleotide-excising tRNase
MIKKFIKIQGTGRFLNYKSSLIPNNNWNGEFKETNLIYGENGSGKTTLSFILRSLKYGSDILKKKRSFNKSFDQNIEILTDDDSEPRLIFDGNNWNQEFNNIEIFDVLFINENIYTGLEIQNTHKKNLFEIIIGERGKALKSDILTIKERIQNDIAEQRTISEKIDIAINHAMPAEKFCLKTSDPKINKKIEEKELEHKAVLAHQQILQKESLSNIDLLKLPIEKEVLAGIFNKNISSISESFLLKFEKHKSELKIQENPEEWLKKGFDAIHEEKCPFCSQKIDRSIEIIEAYHQYFNEEYSSLINDIKKNAGRIDEVQIDSLILQVENSISKNNLLILFWAQYISAPPELTIEIDISSLNEKFKAFKKSFAEKQGDPIHVSSNESSDIFFNEIAKLNQLIQNVNVLISKYNDKISELKNKPHSPTSNLESELKDLKAIKKRDVEDIDNLCTTYSRYNSAITHLNEEKIKKQDELAAYSKSILSSYSQKINDYLRVFAPYLSIKNLDSGYVGSSKEPMVKYALQIDGNDIRSDDKSTQQPSFKFSFSEGDKGAIALSFFFAKLDSDPKLSNKVIVFDDPVSSFDHCRKAVTISKLVSFGQQAKQIIVMSHNIVFAGEYWKSVNQTGSSSLQCCKIERYTNTNCLVDFKIEKESLYSFLKDHKTVKSFLGNGSIQEDEKRGVARCLRPLIESYFYLKFYDLIQPNQWLGTFIEKTRESQKGDPFYRLVPELPSLEEINDYSKKYHHRSNPNADSEPINDTELRTFCTRTLELVQKI